MQQSTPIAKKCQRFTFGKHVPRQVNDRLAWARPLTKTDRPKPPARSKKTPPKLVKGHHRISQSPPAGLRDKLITHPTERKHRAYSTHPNTASLLSGKNDDNTHHQRPDTWQEHLYHTDSIRQAQRKKNLKYKGRETLSSPQPLHKTPARTCTTTLFNVKGSRRGKGVAQRR